MPRRRQRKTNWRPQVERRLLARGVRRGTPDTKKLSRAFIGLALARAEAEARAQVQAPSVAEQMTDLNDGVDEEHSDGSA